MDTGTLLELIRSKRGALVVRGRAKGDAYIEGRPVAQERGATKADKVPGFRERILAALERLSASTMLGHDLLEQIATADRSRTVYIRPCDKGEALACTLPGTLDHVQYCARQAALAGAYARAGLDGFAAQRAALRELLAREGAHGAGSGATVIVNADLDDASFSVRAKVPAGVAPVVCAWEEACPLYITLAHELIHARRMQLGVNRSWDLMADARMRSWVSEEEYLTIVGDSGLRDGRGRMITENAIRQAIGLAPRVEYPPAQSLMDPVGDQLRKSATRALRDVTAPGQAPPKLPRGKPFTGAALDITGIVPLRH
jgi:hypothetical protein